MNKLPFRPLSDYGSGIKNVFPVQVRGDTSPVHDDPQEQGHHVLAHGHLVVALLVVGAALAWGIAVEVVLLDELRIPLHHVGGELDEPVEVALIAFLVNHAVSMVYFSERT